MTTTRELLERLLAATPHPPASGDVDELLAAMATLLPARQQILDQLGDQPRVGTDAERALARNESFWWPSETPEAADLGVSTSFEVYNLGPRPH